MKILQNEITGTQTSFSTNFGAKLSFILSFLFPERFHWCYTYFHCSYLYNYYNYSSTGPKRGWKHVDFLLITLIYATINTTCYTLYSIKPQSWPHTCVMSHCFLCEKNHICTCSSQNVFTPARSRSSGKMFRTQNTVYTKIGGILAWISGTQLMVMQTSLEIIREYNFSSSWI